MISRNNQNTYFFRLQVFVLSKLAWEFNVAAVLKIPSEDKRDLSLDLLILLTVFQTLTVISIQMAGYRLSLDDQKRIPPKYICNQCSFVLREPMQTPCAHFYCRNCLEDLKR